MERILSGYGRIIVILFIGVFVLACGQGRPNTAATTSTEVPTVQSTETTQTVATEEPTSAPAVEAQAQPTVTVNMRGGPGTNYPVLRKVKPNTTVTILAVRNENSERWYRVRVDGDEGWMSVTVLPVDDAVAEALPVDIQALAEPPTATPKPAPVVKPTAKPAQAIVAPAVVEPSSGVRVGAICRDGSRSSATGRGACSHHGGVDHWLLR